MDIKLSTIQKREKLNDVIAKGSPGFGNAYHVYEIIKHGADDDEDGGPVAKIQFQNGARKHINSTPGVIDTDLLEIVRHRLMCFQSSEFKTETNEQALRHVEEALMWLNRRIEDRIERDVLGTYNK
ncbi:MAG: ABC transporter ATPase [Herbinix sp.]|nr:ABC transporter ATPase [Herbinix sp.]